MNNSLNEAYASSMPEPIRKLLLTKRFKASMISRTGDKHIALDKANFIKYPNPTSNRDPIFKDNTKLRFYILDDGNIYVPSINDDDSYDIDLDEGAWFWTDDMLKDIDDVATTDMIMFSESNTVDIGYYLEYCGHRIIKNVYYCGYTHDQEHIYCTTVDGKNQYTLPVDSIEFVIPHED